MNTKGTLDLNWQHGWFLFAFCFVLFTTDCKNSDAVLGKLQPKNSHSFPKYSII